MKNLLVFVTLATLLFSTPVPAEAGRRHGRGGDFWGGFAAGALTSALTGPLLRPPVVVVPPPVVAAPARGHAPRRVWIPGAYVVRYRPCGTPYRVWRRGYYRGAY